MMIRWHSGRWGIPGGYVLLKKRGFQNWRGEDGLTVALGCGQDGGTLLGCMKVGNCCFEEVEEVGSPRGLEMGNLQVPHPIGFLHRNPLRRRRIEDQGSFHLRKAVEENVKGMEVVHW